MTLLRFALAAASALACSAAIAASGAVVSKAVEIKGKTPADIQAKFGAFCAIKDWHPAVAECVESNEGEATFRTLTLKDGGIVKEKLTSKSDEGYSYKIIESPFPVKDYMATFSIKPDGDGEGNARVSWTASFQAKDKPEAEAKTIMQGVIEGGLASLAEMAAK